MTLMTSNGKIDPDKLSLEALLEEHAYAVSQANHLSSEGYGPGLKEEIAYHREMATAIANYIKENYHKKGDAK